MNARRPSSEEERKDSEPVQFVIGRASNVSSWGKPRTRALPQPRRAPATHSLNSQPTQRLPLDASDDDAYVHITLADASEHLPASDELHARDTIPAADTLLMTPSSPATDTPLMITLLTTPSSPATDTPLMIAPPIADAGVRSSQQRSASASSGDDSVPEANNRWLTNGRMGDAAVHRDDPFLATLIHTNALWRRDYDSRMAGTQVVGFPISLFDTETINIESPDHLDVLSDHFRKCYRYDRNQYYIDLFLQMRLYSKKVKMADAVRPSPASLTEAWNWFIGEYNSSPTNWIRRLQAARKRYVDHSLIGFKMEVHQQSIEAGFPCGVRREQDCPFCYKDSKKMPNLSRLNNSCRSNIPPKLLLLMFELDMKCHDAATDQQERDSEEQDAQSDMTSDDYLERDRQLVMQQQVTTANLEIYRLKRNHISLDRQVQKLTKRFNDSEERRIEDRDSLVQQLRRLSDQVNQVSER